MSTRNDSPAPRHVRVPQTVPVMSGGARTMAVVGVGAGMSLLLYPSAADWFAQNAHATEIAGYAEEVASWPDGKRTELLDEAHEYNETLAGGTITDAAGRVVPSLGDTAYKDYLAVLDGGQGEAFGRINIPAIDVSLPIYHGTSEESLQRGVGHLFGTDLPVGGPGTHSVLSGHSGLVSAELFTHLNQLKSGDIFTIEVLGETLYYQVDQITTALPTDISAVQRIEGEDHVTLVTCTPIGVNTHRLLVRGERVEDSSPAIVANQVIGDLNPKPGFPWWAVAFAGGTGAVAGASGIKIKRKPGAPGATGADDDEGEVLMAPSAGGTEWSIEALDEILARVREALARAAIVSDPMDAARALRALATVAWEGANALAQDPSVARPLESAQVIATHEQPSDVDDATEPVDDGYRPRHSAPTRVVAEPDISAPPGGSAAARSTVDLKAVMAAFDAVIADADRYGGEYGHQGRPRGDA